MNYQEFINSKLDIGGGDEVPFSFRTGMEMDFQEYIIGRQLQRGRSATFADCGLGKTLIELAWLTNCVRHTNKPGLLICPLAVSYQMVKESEKFGISAKRSKTGLVTGCDIVITNYESLHAFDPNDYCAVSLDESSILKSFDGAMRCAITEFMKKVRYRLLATATAAPNDYTELGTSSEALGQLGHIDMLNRFFTNNRNNTAMRRMYGESPEWRLKGHAEIHFWRWVTSWAIACRKPSDIGFDDGRFILPDLHEDDVLVKARTRPDGCLFDIPAATLPAQREERKRTITERCEKVAELVDDGDFALVWCNLNAEGDLLEKLIPDSIQVSGKDSDDSKEEKLNAFSNGEARVLVSKPKIGAWGLNFQHCNHVVTFPNHSYEQYYQSVRRCWRFGQKREVYVDVVMTEGDRRVMQNMKRKAYAAEQMFASLVSEMNNSESILKAIPKRMKTEVPSWLI